jgi:hypothetical protein
LQPASYTPSSKAETFLDCTYRKAVSLKAFAVQFFLACEEYSPGGSATA